MRTVMVLVVCATLIGSVKGQGYDYGYDPSPVPPCEMFITDAGDDNNVLHACVQGQMTSATFSHSWFVSFGTAVSAPEKVTLSVDVLCSTLPINQPENSLETGCVITPDNSRWARMRLYLVSANGVRIQVGEAVRTGCANYCPTPILLSSSPWRALTDVEGGVLFDFDGNGVKEQVSWTRPGSGWLVLDRNRNGKIDNGGELFGNYSPQPFSGSRNGFLALAEFDKSGQEGNGDGVIDVNDRVFIDLRLWKDSNHNGVSESDEMTTLPEAGIASISLAYKESSARDRHGNRFGFRSSLIMDNGSIRQVYDVSLLSRSP